MARYGQAIPSDRQKAKVLTRSFIGYLGAGAVAGLVNLLMRSFFSTFVSFEIAVALAFPFGLTCAFIINREYIFDSGVENTVMQYGKFALVNLGALALVWVVSVSLYRVVFPAIGFDWNAELIAHVVGVGSPVILTFIAYRYFVFSGLK